MTQSQWVTIPKPNPEAAIRLFCLPGAGGSAALFRQWPNILFGYIEICAIQLPGRGARLHEAPFTSMQLLIDALAGALVPFLDKFYAIFGQGLGALIGFELARTLRKNSNTLPTRLFVAGQPAPQIPNDSSLRYNLPDPEFIEALKQMSSTPTEILEHPELMQVMLPLLRADLELGETYVYRAEAPFEVPITVYGGLRDADISLAALESWSEQTTAAFEVRMFPDDHLSLHSAPSRLLEAIDLQLASYESGASRMGEDKAIHAAAVEGNVKKLKALLDKDRALIHEPGLWRRTPLHAAAEAGEVECVRFLIEQGAKVDARDRLYSWTPLFSALVPMHYVEAKSKQLACARLLLEHGADPNVRDTHRRETPVFDACTFEALNLLGEFGANFDVVSAEDEYPYESQARSGWDIRMLRFWLSRGVNVNHSPRYGSPVLEAVVSHLGTNVTSEEEVAQVRELLEYRADPEVAERLFGHTPLHTAAKNGRADLATMLLDRGADPNSRTHRGETPLHLAAEEDALEVVHLLLDRGAYPNTRDLWGKPPLDRAKKPRVRKILKGVTDKTAPAPLTPKELVARLLEVPRLEGMSLEPCSDGEISHLEQTFGVSLPESYKKFLRLMGRGEKYFLECDHWDAFYPELLQMGQGEQYLDRCPDLPSDYFVFAQRLSQSLFFVADGTDDDPPIYSFEWETYKKVYESFWDFFREMVILNEVHGR